jgi:hypothetical protein
MNSPALAVLVAVAAILQAPPQAAAISGGCAVQITLDSLL